MNRPVMLAYNVATNPGAPVHNLTLENVQIGLRTAITILEKWGASIDQASRTLGMSCHVYSQVRESLGGQGLSLEIEQIDRIGVVLNIHATLCLLFENPENVYGFPAMPNHNPFFNGRSPLEAMAEGDMHSLSETYRWLDSMLLR
jgi:hypothetical protein